MSTRDSFTLEELSHKLVSATFSALSAPNI